MGANLSLEEALNVWPTLYTAFALPQSNIPLRPDQLVKITDSGIEKALSDTGSNKDIHAARAELENLFRDLFINRFHNKYSQFISGSKAETVLRYLDARASNEDDAKLALSRILWYMEDWIFHSAGFETKHLFLNPNAPKNVYRALSPANNEGKAAYFFAVRYRNMVSSTPQYYLLENVPKDKVEELDTRIFDFFKKEVNKTWEYLKPLAGVVAGGVAGVAASFAIVMGLIGINEALHKIANTSLPDAIIFMDSEYIIWAPIALGAAIGGAIGYRSMNRLNSIIKNYDSSRNIDAINAVGQYKK